MGVVSPTYALVLPLVLPVVSLVAALQREDLLMEDNRAYLSRLGGTLQGDAGLLLREARAAVEDIRRELAGMTRGGGVAGGPAQGGVPPLALGPRLAALEGKLGVLEGALLGAARDTREASAAVGSLPDRLNRESRAQAEQLLGAVKGELRKAVSALASEESAAIARLDARLAAVEGSLAGLEVAQSEGLRRLSMNLSSAIADAESTLQSAVRNEAARSLEPVRRLPQMLAAVMPLQQATLPAPAQQPPAEGPEGAIAEASVALQQQLRDVVAEEVGAAVSAIVEQQQELLARLSAPPRAAPLAEEQWDALGRRLARLERLIDGVAPAQAGALAATLAPLSEAQLAAEQRTAEAAERLQEALTIEVAGARAVVEGIAARLESTAAAPGPAGEGGEAVATTAPSVAGLEERLQELRNLVGAELEGIRLAVEAGGRQQADVVAALTAAAEQQRQQQLSASAASGPTGLAAAAVADQIAELQRGIGNMGIAVQRLTQEIPAQITLLAARQARYEPAGSSGDGDGGTSSSGDGAGAAAAAAAATAAAAAAAAANGVAELKDMLSVLSVSVSQLQQQLDYVGSEFATVSTQQQQLQMQLQALEDTEAEAAAAANSAAASSSSSSAVDAAELETALGDAVGRLSGQLAGELSLMRSDMEGQLAALEGRLAEAAAEAAAAAAQGSMLMLGAAGGARGPAGDAAQIGMSDGSYAGWQQQQQQQPGDGGRAAAEAAASAAAAAAASGGWGMFQGGPAPAQAAEWDAGVAPGPNLGPQPALAGDVAGPWGPLAAGAGAIGIAHRAAPQPEQQRPQQTPAAAAASLAPQQAPPTPPALQLPDVASMALGQLIPEGLRLLRGGRDATRATGTYSAAGPDYAAAKVLLGAAAACFERHLSEVSEGDSRALGNLGNVLLAQGELEMALLSELMASGPDLSPEEEQAKELAELRMRGEASSLLTRAGEMFRGVVESDGWSSRALVNWGKAMTGRAQLAGQGEAAEKLYNAAIDKFEAVLAEEPGLAVAQYRCALAMRGLAGVTRPPRSRKALTVLEDAVNYLSDVVDASGPEGGSPDEGLRAAAAAALAETSEQLELARLA